MGHEAGSIAELLHRAGRRLIGTSDSPRLDAELLLAHALDRPRSYLYTWSEHRPEANRLTLYLELIERRRRGEPVAYLTGRREFWSLELEVTPDTLIPRPETELLVELALVHLPLDVSADVADLGTGSGAIALAIAHERPRVRLTATDVSTSALAVAERNARRLGLSNIQFMAGDWCAALPDRPFDLIVSNPPYIAVSSDHPRRGDLRFEPRSALVAGGAGLAALRAIIDQAPSHLNVDGWLLLEHGFDQGEAVAALLRERGFTEVATHRDPAGHDRVAMGRWPQIRALSPRRPAP